MKYNRPANFLAKEGSMKKRATRKLSLSKETVRNLQEERIQVVVGGESFGSICCYTTPNGGCTETCPDHSWCLQCWEI
jgi:hypothetical protein